MGVHKSERGLLSLHCLCLSGHRPNRGCCSGHDHVIDAGGCKDAIYRRGTSSRHGFAVSRDQTYAGGWPGRLELDATTLVL